MSEIYRELIDRDAKQMPPRFSHTMYEALEIAGWKEVRKGKGHHYPPRWRRGPLAIPFIVRDVNKLLHEAEGKSRN